MTTTRTTDQPYRLRELAHLDSRIAGLLTDDRSPDECNGVLMARYVLDMRRMDLEAGRYWPTKVKPRAAALSECGKLVVWLRRLRLDPALNAGERSGISDALAVAQVRLDFIVRAPRELVDLARQREEADVRENAKRIAARKWDRESRQEAGGMQGSRLVREDGVDWAWLARWGVAIAGLVALALAGIWADLFAGR